MAAERDRQRKGSAQARQDHLDRVFGRQSRLDLFRHEMRDDFGVGLAFESAAARDQFLAQGRKFSMMPL
jgi:hypothetical protein